MSFVDSLYELAPEPSICILGSRRISSMAYESRCPCGQTLPGDGLHRYPPLWHLANYKRSSLNPPTNVWIISMRRIPFYLCLVSSDRIDLPAQMQKSCGGPEAYPTNRWRGVVARALFLYRGGLVWHSAP